MKVHYSEGIEELLSAVEALVKRKGRAVIVIDGRAASGKSTLADLVAKHIGGCVVRADDFFLPFDMRTPERLNTPGGNIHHERFAEEVVAHLGEEFLYGVFDCSAGCVTTVKKIKADVPVVIEGAYSASPVFGRYYDMLVFVTAAFDDRIERIVKRNGKDKTEVFKNRWIPLEEAYFEAFGIENVADIIIDTTGV